MVIYDEDEVVIDWQTYLDSGGNSECSDFSLVNLQANNVTCHLTF